MRSTIAFDTEGALFRPGLQLPPITCASWAVGDSGFLTHQTELHDLIKDALERACQGEVLLVGHNMAYDMGVVCAEYPDLIPLVFRAYENDGITCTEMRQRMLDIADGKYGEKAGFDYIKGKGLQKITYTLDFTVQRYFDHKLEGKGEVQLGYGKLRDVPIEQWTEEECTYPVQDALWTLKIFQAQEERIAELEDQYRQARAAFWLRLMSAWGMRTDRIYVERYLRGKLDDYNRLKDKLIAAGLVRSNGKRNTKAAKDRLEQAWPYSELGAIPLTDSGALSLAKDTLRKSGDVLLIDYADYSGASRSINTNGPILLSGVDQPIHTRFIPIRETGRTSSKNPNIQNPDRAEGFRECFIPSVAGNVFIQADWSSFESVCLAQVCYTVLGHSRLGDALNAGLDPHLEIASLILREPYDSLVPRIKERVVDMARQTGKVANFGLPGGLGAASLVDFAYKGYKVELTIEEAQALKDHWLTAWPEMREYFRWVNSMVGRSQHGGTIQHLFSNRYRGDARFTQACNSFFQGLAADIAKEAGFWIHKEMYAVPSSPLFGFRGVAFIHDEFIGEGPEDRAPEAAERMSQIMVETAERWLPNMKVKAAPCVMDRWSKKAEGIRDENGRLTTYHYAR